MRERLPCPKSEALGFSLLRCERSILTENICPERNTMNTKRPIFNLILKRQRLRVEKSIEKSVITFSLECTPVNES